MCRKRKKGEPVRVRAATSLAKLLCIKYYWKEKKKFAQNYSGEWGWTSTLAKLGRGKSPNGTVTQYRAWKSPWAPGGLSFVANRILTKDHYAVEWIQIWWSHLDIKTQVAKIGHDSPPIERKCARPHAPVCTPVCTRRHTFFRLFIAPEITVCLCWRWQYRQRQSHATS